MRNSERAGKRWGKPFSALFWERLRLERELGVGAIGGKVLYVRVFREFRCSSDLQCSFAVTAEKAGNIVSPEFKRAGNKVILLAPEFDENKLPKTASSCVLCLIKYRLFFVRGKQSLAILRHTEA